MHYKEYKTILSPQNNMNIYRGCTHGCIYCDSRSNCYQINHEFEDIEVKTDAPFMLERTLRRKQKGCMVSTGAMSDPYMHAEEKLQYMRKCLETIDFYGHGVCILTKSNRILRDLDILKRINKHSKCIVQVTLTTADEELCKILEPNVSTTKERFEVLKIMRDNGIRTIVWLTPFLPYINDTEENIRKLLDMCIEAKVYGIMCFGIGLTLRAGNREYFYKMLDENFAGMKEKYIKSFGNNYICNSDNANRLMNIINYQCKKNEIVIGTKKLFSYMQKYEEKCGGQLILDL